MRNHHKNRLPFLLVVLSALALASFGCARHTDSILGIAPAAAATVTPVKELAKASGNVSVHGEMVEKCPIAGCWFILRDKTGTVRIDTKSAGFVVTEVPLHTQMTVMGSVTPGTEPGLKATGLRY